MAILNFISGKIISLKDDGTPNSGGKVYFYEPGNITPKNTYPTAADAVAGTNANANPLILDSAGRGTAFYSGNIKIIIHTSDDVLIYPQDSISPIENSSITARSTPYTLIQTDSGAITEASGTITLTLTAAATLAVGWRHLVKNVGSGVITIARAAGGDAIDGSAANITIPAGHARWITVNVAASGFFTEPSYSSSTFNERMIFAASAPTNFTAGLGPEYLQNLGLAASVSAKALTIAAKGKDLSDPSTTNKAEISFRNATATTGDYVVRSVTAALSVVVPSTATLGFTANEDGLIYIYAIDNAGTVELAVAKKALFSEAVTHNTTAISTSADSDDVLYSTSARTGVAIRLVGRLRITTGAVAGEWDNAPTRAEMWRSSMKKTGDIIQTKHKTYVTHSSTANNIAIDDTIPQSSEGAEFYTDSITPTSSINTLLIDACMNVYNGSGGAATVISVYQDSTADALASGVTTHAAGYILQAKLKHSMSSGTTSSTTFKIRAGSNTGTLYVNGLNTGRIYGGVLRSWLTVVEIQA